MDTLNDTNKYFAAQEDAKKVASVLMGKTLSFYDRLSNNLYLDKLAKMWGAYHGVYGDFYDPGHKISFTGDQGELVTIPCNHFRNLAQHIYNMITATRPIMEARAINTDYKSKAQTILANGILDYYMREKSLEDVFKRAVEYSIVMGSSFIQLSWNATGGDIYDVDEATGKFSYDGEIESKVLSPFDIVFDGTKEAWDKSQEWVVCRSRQNKFNLIAKYPEATTELLGTQSVSEESPWLLKLFSNDSTDDIFVYEFFHKKTEAVPEGRYMLYTSDSNVLLDLPLPYRDIPVYRISAGEILGTPYGYSPMFDIYPLQEAINMLVSGMLTNLNAFLVQNVFVPRGADINPVLVVGGLNIIEGNAKPEALQLAATPDEAFKLLNLMITFSETFSGINSVTRGNPEANLRSGSALALVQSMALQFASGLQQSYVKLIQDVGGAVIQILKDFSTTPKAITLVGKNNRYMLKEFTGSDIDSVSRVIVDMGNALSRSTAGRVQMAEQMLQMGAIKTANQYFQVLETGRVDTMYQGEVKELMNITRENEDLMEGTAVQALYLDGHSLHILEHRTLLDDPDLRRDANLIELVMTHIQEHVDLLRTTDPDLLILIGQQPLVTAQEQQQQDQMSLAAGQPPGDGNLAQFTTENPSPIGQMMQPDAPGNVKGGESIVDNKMQNVVIPQAAAPPAPFQNLPTDPGQQ